MRVVWLLILLELWTRIFYDSLDDTMMIRDMCAMLLLRQG